MSKESRYRSRFSHLDIPAQGRVDRPRAITNIRFNKRAHARHHGSSLLVYTSIVAIPVTAGSFVYMPIGGRIQTIKGIVQVAPTGDFAFDVLEDGQTIFHTSPGPVILSGAVEGTEARPDRNSFQIGTKLYVQATTVNGATGPLIMVMCIDPAYHN